MKLMTIISTNLWKAQLAGTVEYTTRISAEE